MENILVTASVASMIDLFNRDNMNILEDIGFKVIIATNFNNGNTYKRVKAQQFKSEMTTKGRVCEQVPFSRSIYRLVDIVYSVILIEKILHKHNISKVHCHSPIGSVATRIAVIKYNLFKRKKIEVLYTAHGFHFYEGSSKLSWLLYYPIERILCKFTDKLITINSEDYLLGKKMNKNTFYIPGVGIDSFDRLNSSTEIDFPYSEENFNIISVGELSRDKNHIEAIKAISKINDEKIHYYICGEGKQKVKILSYIKNTPMENRVHLLGFRTDVTKIVSKMNLFLFPSIREGLPVAMMEAMDIGIHVIASNIRGNKDLHFNSSKCKLYPLNNTDELAKMIKDVMNQKIEISSLKSYLPREYYLSNVSQIMRNIYSIKTR